MADLHTDVRYIKGIGETRAKALAKLGITTLQELIGYFPRRYEDRTMTRPFGSWPWARPYACAPCWPTTPPPAAFPAGARW